MKNNRHEQAEVRPSVVAAKESLRRQDREIVKKYAGLLAVTLAGATVLGIGANHLINSSDNHDIGYLDQYDKTTVVVEPGDTPNQLLNEATGGESGQLRQDLLEYIGNQERPDANGVDSIFPGQKIVIPVPPESQSK